MVEKNITLNFLSISGLSKLNKRAVESIEESLVLNRGLKLITMKKTDSQFIQEVETATNRRREQMQKPRIIFINEGGQTKVTKKPPKEEAK
jgi:hypothetical protein